MKFNLMNKLGGVALLTVTMTLGARANIVYDNTSTDTGYNLSVTNGQMVGDQIILNSSTPVTLTSFSFEFYSPNATFTGSVMGEVWLYANDGAGTLLSGGYATPSTVLLDSTPFSLSTAQQYTSASPGGPFDVATLNFDLLPNGYPTGLVVPTNFTMVVSFTGLTGSDSVGVELFNPVTVGQNYPDYWYLNNGEPSSNWSLLTNSVTPVNFGAQFVGTVPEPSMVSFALAGMAGLVGMGLGRRRR